MFQDPFHGPDDGRSKMCHASGEIEHGRLTGNIGREIGEIRVMRSGELVSFNQTDVVGVDANRTRFLTASAYQAPQHNIAVDLLIPHRPEKINSLDIMNMGSGSKLADIDTDPTS